MGSAKALKSYVSNIDDKFMEGFCCCFPFEGINFSNALLLYIVDAAFEATAELNMTPTCKARDDWCSNEDARRLSFKAPTRWFKISISQSYIPPRFMKSHYYELWRRIAFYKFFLCYKFTILLGLNDRPSVARFLWHAKSRIYLRPNSVIAVITLCAACDDGWLGDIDAEADLSEINQKTMLCARAQHQFQIFPFALDSSAEWLMILILFTQAFDKCWIGSNVCVDCFFGFAGAEQKKSVFKQTNCGGVCLQDCQKRSFL